jgi:xanthine dehydrogenase iron-sulfur cluster and FAD-binding subunit A
LRDRRHASARRSCRVVAPIRNARFGDLIPGDVGLNEVKQSADSLSIGATVSHREATATLGRLHPDLGELLRRFASIQIRNAGTVGGNIANGSPIGDLAPALIALGATLRLRCDAARRELPLEAFFLAYGKQDRAPGEFVEAVQVPRLGAATRFACYKISRRFDQDICAVMGAFALTLKENTIVHARVAYGGIAATPKRAEKTEATLTGLRANDHRARVHCPIERLHPNYRYARLGGLSPSRCAEPIAAANSECTQLRSRTAAISRTG